MECAQNINQSPNQKRKKDNTIKNVHEKSSPLMTSSLMEKAEV